MSLELTNKVTLVDLSISVFGGVKVDRKITREVVENHNATAGDSGRFAKQTISKHSLAAVHNAAATARTLHAELTLPYADSGARLLSVTGYFTYLEQMKLARDNFHTEVDRFIDVYPRLIEEARVRLNGMFDPQDYPPKDALGDRFAFDMSMMPLPATQNWFLDLAEEEMITIREEADKRISSNIEGAVKDVYRRVAEVTQKMVERLGAFRPANGDNKAEGVFRDSLVENVRELTDIMPTLNITGDLALDHLTQTMRQALCSHDASALREDERVRADVAAAAQAVFDKAAMFLA